MDQIALKLYRLKKKNVLVFSKPQIFEKQIETFSSSVDIAQRGQLGVQKEESGSGVGFRGRQKDIPAGGAWPWRRGCKCQLCACVCVCVCTPKHI